MQLVNIKGQITEQRLRTIGHELNENKSTDQNDYATTTNAPFSQPPSLMHSRFSVPSPTFIPQVNMYPSRIAPIPPAYDMQTPQQNFAYPRNPHMVPPVPPPAYYMQTQHHNLAHPGNPLLATLLQTISSTAHLQQTQRGHQAFSLQQRTQPSSSIKMHRYISK